MPANWPPFSGSKTAPLLAYTRPPEYSMSVPKPVIGAWVIQELLRGTTPFGGFRQSGFWGRDNGPEAMAGYQEAMTVWVSDN